MEEGGDEIARRWCQTLGRLLIAPDDAAAERAEAALDLLTAELFAIPPTSLDLVRARLDMLIELAPIKSGGVEEFPWPELVQMSAGLKRRLA